MIVFDLSTLADDSHRRHFIQAPEDYCERCYIYLVDPESIKNPLHVCSCGRQPGIWRQNFQAYYDAMDKDEPIKAVLDVFTRLSQDVPFNYIQIWSPQPEFFCEKA